MSWAQSMIHWLFPQHAIVFLHPCPRLCVSVSCTRLRGVSTPQTSPEHTWVPHGCSIKVFSLLKGMYQCSELMEEHLHEPVVTNIFFLLLFSFFFPILAFFLALCISLFIFYCPHFPPYFPGFVYSARSVCGVAMRLMRTRFPLLPGNLIWRRCIPAVLQSRYKPLAASPVYPWLHSLYFHWGKLSSFPLFVWFPRVT